MLNICLTRISKMERGKSILTQNAKFGVKKSANNVGMKEGLAAA